MGPGGLVALAVVAAATAAPGHAASRNRTDHGLRCPIATVALTPSRGATVVSIDGQLLQHRLPFGLRAQVTGGSATVSFRGVTYTLSSGSRFFTTCAAPGDLRRRPIPMLALSAGRTGVSTVTVDDPPGAVGEAGALSDRLAAIGHAGQRWTLTLDGPPTAAVSVSATATALSGGPVEAVVPRAGGQRRHAVVYEIGTGHSLTVVADQVVSQS